MLFDPVGLYYYCNKAPGTSRLPDPDTTDAMMEAPFRL